MDKPHVACACISCIYYVHRLYYVHESYTVYYDGTTLRNPLRQDYNYPDARDRQYLNFFSKMATRNKFDVDK